MVRLKTEGQFDGLLGVQEDEQGAPDADEAEQIQYPFFTEGRGGGVGESDGDDEARGKEEALKLSQGGLDKFKLAW